MKPSSLSSPLIVKRTANQMKVASTSPSLAMSPSVKHAGDEQRAEAEERDRGRVDAERRGRRPQRDHADEGRRHDLLVPAQRPERRQRLPRRARGLGRRRDLGPDHLVEDERQQRHRHERRDDGGRRATSRTRSRRRTRARSPRRAGSRPWPSTTAPTTRSGSRCRRTSGSARAARRPASPGRAPAASATESASG